MYTVKTCAIWIGTSKNLQVWSIKPFWAFLPGQNRVNFFHSISYLVAIFVPERYTNKAVFDQEKLLEITWKSPPLGFWACWLQWWCLELCHQIHQYVCHVFSCAISLLAVLFLFISCRIASKKLQVCLLVSI